MKIPVIKNLVEQFSTDQLNEAENALLEGLTPAISIEGEDEGEQLTHIMAAIWIKHEMQKNKVEFTKALRGYTARVRKSID